MPCAFGRIRMNLPSILMFNELAEKFGGLVILRSRRRRGVS